MFELPLPKKLAAQRWKVKIWDNEIRESPHITIICKTQRWRWALRERAFMDAIPDPSQVPVEVMEEITRQHNVLVREWDRIHPSNPVRSAEEDQHE